MGGTIETPKTAGIRNVQPFQLNVPGSGADNFDQQVNSFNPSEGTGGGSNQLGTIHRSDPNNDMIRNLVEENKSHEDAPKVKELEDDQDKTREQEMLDKMTTEKNSYKLADYFITIGLDNYNTPEEVYSKQQDDGKPRESVPSSEL